jgi:transcriptional regulator with XRE-family HTH domain
MVNRLKEFRDGLGLTLESVAGDVGISVSQLSRFESGDREPRLHEARAIARHYKTSVDALWPEIPGGDDLDRATALVRQHPDLVPRVVSYIEGALAVAADVKPAPSRIKRS